jgi:SAM-dependent methyltransferase
LNTPAPSDFTLAERLFLRLWCVAPPPKPFEPRDSYDASKPPPLDPDPLARARRVYGDAFEKALVGKTFLDIGCGHGEQVVAAAEAGAALAVGVDTVEVKLRMGEAHAAARGVKDRVRFTTDPTSTFGTDWVDVVLSQNSFEHFGDPGDILAQAYRALRPGGRFFVTFGPPWAHPFGVHHMFMIKLPWAHFVFSEKTILRVRQLYRPNKPTSWADVALNQMTVAKFLRLVKASGFDVSHITYTPIGGLPQWLVRMRPFREWTTSDVTVILTKPARA